MGKFKIKDAFGNCNVYAIAMHRLYKYPIYAINGYFKEDDWDDLDEDERIYNSEVAHVFNKLPNGLYVDYQGVYTELEMKKLSNTSYFEFMELVEMSEIEARNCFGGVDELEIQSTMETIKTMI